MIMDGSEYMPIYQPTPTPTPTYTYSVRARGIVAPARAYKQILQGLAYSGMRIQRVSSQGLGSAETLIECTFEGTREQWRLMCDKLNVECA